jgi:integrase
MTVVDFVEKFFVPEHVATKAPSGRTHYQAILKHVLTPEDVNRVFGADLDKSRVKLKASSDWPYLGGLKLCDTRPENVHRLITAALAHGYSTQTVRHIRSVVSAIFAHAAKKPWFAGGNPATPVILPESTRKEAHALTLSQVQTVLASMRYPEKEMSLLAILTDLNITEICGLRWKCVNLGIDAIHDECGSIPERSISIKNEIVSGALANGPKRGRDRNVPIPEPLFPMLAGLRRRGTFNGPHDFVLASRSGAPPNGKVIAARRLKEIGKRLGMPWLSWQVFRRTHTTLTVQLGTSTIGEHVVKRG